MLFCLYLDSIAFSTNISQCVTCSDFLGLVLNYPLGWNITGLRPSIFWDLYTEMTEWANDQQH